MGPLAALAGVFGIEVEALVQGLKRGAIVHGAIALLLLVALAFALVAGFIALSAETGPLAAALILCGGALLLALVIFVADRIAASNHRRQLRERRRRSASNALIATAATTALPALLRSSRTMTIGLPLVALVAFLVTRESNEADEES